MVHPSVVAPAAPQPAVDRRSGALALALAAVPAAWLVAATALVFAAWAGYTPFLTPSDLTLSEAAVVRDHLEILRQIEAGVDPNRPGRIRADLVRPDESMMTPLEAAVISRRLETVELLHRHGARIDAATLPTLLCMAQRQNDDDIALYLRNQAPADLVVRCEGVALPWVD